MSPRPTGRRTPSIPAPSHEPAPAPEQKASRPVLDSIPRSVQVAAGWSWRLVAITIALAGVVVALSVGKVIWVSVVVALLLTVLLLPVVNYLEARLRFPRGAAAGLSVIGLVAFVTGLLTMAGREIVQGFADLRDQALEGFDALLEYAVNGPLGLDRDEIDGYVAQIGDQIGSNSQTLISGALSVTTTIGQVFAGTLIALFCLLFFLKDGKTIWAWLIRLLPVGSRMPAFEASRRGMLTLGSYVRAQILVALVDAIGIGVGAAILGLPLALPLGVLVFLASFIPFVGAIATGAIAILVALVDQGPATALIMAAIVLGVQQLEGNVLQPLLLGHAVSLHPVAVLLVVTGGALAAGIVGALLAVPIAATINTVVLYLHGRDKFPALGLDPGGLESELARLSGPPSSKRKA
ncbi:AI-2E family transporter [Actinotalea sp. K2]|uniref:AI-2E family transporter n=1 Tax=Actinotalea sp. K2 TaxID=2939438 RepID=UPI00201775BF|nr:AI-2E family transporter [Actinotalea sp. K2]MCL3862551.1 AI-2E family transporter [Actinotalea sp. K2]